MYKITIFIPTSHKEIVKTSMFKAGAGKIGNYDCCSFEQTGLGQFRPLNGSNPHIGTSNKIELVEEARVEMVCENKLLKNVIKALKISHPYETPAFDIIELSNIC